jgi:hypothetical protein
VSHRVSNHVHPPTLVNSERACELRTHLFLCSDWDACSQHERRGWFIACVCCAQVFYFYHVIFPRTKVLIFACTNANEQSCSHQTHTPWRSQTHTGCPLDTLTASRCDQQQLSITIGRMFNEADRWASYRCFFPFFVCSYVLTFALSTCFTHDATKVLCS